MTLSPGTRLGAYEIAALIGAGGMGEVYRARDTRLNRDVALKVLPDHFAADADRLARFQREAQVLAALNHPNIAGIHGLEEGGGIRALVLELVEGETLADRIERGPIPPDEALPIARQIAEALEAAHEQGVVHRDLKPSNVKVTADGSVMVLDFGLAKLSAAPGAASGVNRPDATASPTITSPAMMTGIGRPLWSRNSRELFYVSVDNALMAVRVEAVQTWITGTPQPLFSNPNLNIPGYFGPTYDVSADGRRFLILKLVSNEETPSDRVQLLVVQNWMAELQSRVPAN